MKDIYQAIGAGIGKVYGAVTASANGATFDKQAAGFNYQDVVALVQTGAWTDGTHTFTWEDSPDGTTWTAAAASDVRGTLAIIDATDDDAVFVLGYNGAERFCRLIVTISGTTTGLIFGFTMVAGDATTLPIRT